jgi:hypothetical protein
MDSNRTSTERHIDIMCQLNLYEQSQARMTYNSEG